MNIRRHRAISWLALALAFAPAVVRADDGGLAAKARVVMERPAFRHSTFGLMYYDLDARKPIYSYNADRFFAPASTTKVITEGTLLALLGPAFRFHTRVYSSAPVGSDGVLGTQTDVNFVADKAAPDGTRKVTIAGFIPAGLKPALNAYAIPSPSTFARIALTEALTAAGVTVHATNNAQDVDSAQSLLPMYAHGGMIAEHVSPPLSEDVKVTLKVSQNLHAHLAMYNVGVYKAHATTDVEQAGFDEERRYLVGTGVDPDSAAIADGEGTAYLTPHFVVSYLAYMWKQPLFPIFDRALPVLGVDGTLWNIQKGSPAAGHVHAKTGTDEQLDLLNRRVLVNAKGLAGYVSSRHGRHIAFAVYVNNVDVKDDEAVTSVAGQAMGELATLAYEL